MGVVAVPATARCHPERRELELDGIPCLKVFNKIDLVAPEVVAEQLRLHEAVAVSARDAATFVPFLDRAKSLVLKKWQTRGEYAQPEIEESAPDAQVYSPI